MCPLCFSTLAWVALGGGSSGSLAALLIAFNRKGTDDGDDDGDASDRDA
jgi:hypothetical protein